MSNLGNQQESLRSILGLTSPLLKTRFGFFVVFVVLFFLIGGPFFSHAGPDEWFALFFLGPLVSISCLLGGYAGLGHRVSRWPVVLILAPVLGWYADYSTGGNAFLEFQTFVLGMVGVSTGTTLGLRVWRGSLRPLVEGELVVDGLQFGVKDLLIWTTLAAIFLAVSQWIVNIQGLDFSNNRQLLSIFGLAACLAISMVVDVWALLSHRITPARLAVVFTVTFASATGCYYVMMYEAMVFSYVAIPHQVVMICLILLLRREGYRFVKSPEGSSATNPVLRRE